MASKSYRKFMATGLSAAVVASVVAPVASAAYDDVKPGAWYEEAINYVTEMEYMQGTGKGFEPGSDMTRAQAAQLFANILGLDGTDLEVDFTDVKEGAWYYEAIAAVKEHGVMNGSGAKFNPNATLTRGEMAAIIVRAYELSEHEGREHSFTDIEGNQFATEIAILADLGIVDGVSEGKFAPNAEVTRAQMASFIFKTEEPVDEVEVPEVTSVSAIANNKIQVEYNTSVKDATFTLKRGLINVAVEEVTFDETGKVVTITTVDKLQTSDYTVTAKLGEVEVSEDVSVKAEHIASIEIAGEVLPKSTATPVAYTVFNQYGEEMEVDSSNLTFVFSAGSTVDSDPSDQAIAVNTNALEVDSNLTVTILDATTGVSAKKTFKVAAASAVSSLSLKEVVLPTTTPATVRTYENTANTTVSFEAHDQFGNKLTKYGELSGVQLVDSSSNVTLTWADKDGGTDPTKDAVLKVTVGDLTADETVIATAVLPNGETSKLTFTVYDSPKAADVTVGGISNVVAANDQDVAVDLNVVDQFGTALTADQVVAQASGFTLNSTNTGIVNNVAIATTGDNKGKLVFDAVAKGTATISVIVNATGETANLNVTVSEARHVSKIELANEPAAKLLQGATTEVKYKLYDQYGKAIADADQANYKVNLSLTKVSGDDAAVTGTTGDLAESAVVGETLTYTAAADKTGEYKLTAKVQNDAGTSTLSQVSTNFVVVDGSKDTLTYAVSEIPTLYKDGSASAYYHEVKVEATDAQGKKVALPADAIKEVLTSDASVADVSGNKVFGVDKGEATITVIFNTPKGLQTVTKTATVSEAVLSPQSIKANVDNNEILISAATLNGQNLTVDTSDLYFTVTDQFAGSSLVPASFYVTNVKDASVVAGTEFTVADVTFTDGADADTLVDTIAISGDAAAGDSFEVIAVTSNGKTVKVTVTLN